MTLDPALIAELQAAGLDVAPGDDPAMIRRQLRARIVARASAPPGVFDRATFDRLMQLEAALPPETEDAGDGD